MRKLILIEFLTLNGVIQGPGGPEEDTSGGFKYGGWIVPYSDEVLGKVIREQMKEPFNLLLGRKTYDNWAAYWPDHEDNWPGINAATKYVASRTPSLKLDWENSILITGDIVREVKNLKEQDGLDLHVYGSGDLIQTLLKHDLVDELRLRIFPITLGAGKSLFAEGTTPVAFQLIDSSVSSKGVIIARYERAGDIKTGSF
ncbi:MAG: dihydrofolate reductase family protein [Candidatus Nanopelagicaceae bacterium]